ncbi:AAA family ATPase [Streptomyces sp. NRRL S-350]|uniref:AAA family ATPase n=1 Tax=Streptomyces sp. NRRL S-350 TaxID=1463902 RepID=UPI0004C29CC2|nr:AAA family ATPase [Streptomyces sp. NRRL S-350]
MITSIAIDGFKSFQDFEFEFPSGPLTVLTGPAGTGKTNLLDALTLVSRTLTDGWEAATTSSPRLAADAVLLQGEHEGQPRTAQRMRITVQALMPGTAGPVSAELTAFRAPDGRTAVLDTAGSGVRMAARTGAPQRLIPLDGTGAVMDTLREQARNWQTASGGTGDTASMLRRLSPEAATRLAADLAALVHGSFGVRTAHGRIEVRMAHRGWVAMNTMPAGALRLLEALAAWHTKPGVLVLDGIGEGIHPKDAVELARRISRRLGGASSPSQLIASTHALDLVNALSGGDQSAMVVIEKAHRVDPAQQTITPVSIALPVREPLPEEEPGHCVRPSRLLRMLSAA